jgi:hypothetical protein
MRRTIPLGLAFALLTGCGTSLPPVTDPVAGRDVLKTVLDTWARGGSPADLKAGRSPVVAYDPDWEDGYKLVKYELAPTDRRAGVDLLVSVKLTVAKGSDKPREKTVNFTVAIGSQTVVIRQT